MSCYLPLFKEELYLLRIKRDILAKKTLLIISLNSQYCIQLQLSMQKVKDIWNQCTLETVWSPWGLLRVFLYKGQIYYIRRLTFLLSSKTLQKLILSTKKNPSSTPSLIIMKFSLLASTVFTATGLANFHPVSLPQPLDWVPSRELMDRQVCPTMTADYQKFTAKTWAEHVLRICETTLCGCESTIGYSRKFSM